MKAKGIYNLTCRYSFDLDKFYKYIMFKKKYKNVKLNNYSMKKMTKNFPSLNFESTYLSINKFKNEG